MSVTKDQYIIYGIELDTEMFDYDEIECLLFSGDATDRFGILYDVGSGSYAFAGLCFSYSDGWEGDLNFSVSPDDILEKEAEVRAWLHDNIFDEQILDIKKGLDLHVITHYH